MALAYRLPDEPLPSGLGRYVTDPMWPLLALMLGGNGFGLAWFLVNGAAVGTPRRSREWLLAALSVFGSMAIAASLGLAAQERWLSESSLRYAWLGVVVLKIAVGYVLYLGQARVFALWEHFGGRARNGLPVLMLLLAVMGPGLLRGVGMSGLLAVALR